MKRSVVVALVLVALVLGGALVVYRRVFEAPEEKPAAVVVSDVGKRPDGGATTTSPAVEPAPPAKEQRATVVQARGKVEVKNAQGEWVLAAPGQVLGPDEAVRTGRNGEANLAFGDGIEVRLSPRSEFSVRQLQADLSKIRLEEGHVAASVDPSKSRALQVEAQGSDALAESKGGSFGVVADGRGQLTVATETGSVKLSARGKTVEVEAGTTSTVTAEGDGPSAPREIPKSLFVKLQDVEKKRTNEASTTIEGEATPGSVVMVDGQLAAVDSRGRFKVRVRLKDGANVVPVNVLDAMGRTTSTSTSEIVLDREKPTIETEMKWGGGG